MIRKANRISDLSWEDSTYFTRALISRYALLSYIVNKDIYGIHHVTAITSDPQRNIDFYANDLGLRFIKLTVNQDDPSSYHLYYGDELGRPG